MMRSYGNLRGYLCAVCAVLLLAHGCGGGDDDTTVTFQVSAGGAARDAAYSGQPTGDGCYVVAGTTESFGAGGTDAYLVKFDSKGNVLWQKTFGGLGSEMAVGLTETAGGGFVLVGYTSSYGQGGADVYVVRTDRDGNLLWWKAFGSPGDEGGHAVQQTADGGFVIAGVTDWDTAGGDDAYLLRIDGTGKLLWQQKFGGADRDEAVAVQQTADGGFVLAGSTESGGLGLRDVFLVRTDPAGGGIWAWSHGGPQDDQAAALHPTADGGFMVAGMTESFGAGLDDVYLLKVNPDGSRNWHNWYGGTGTDRGYALWPTTDGGWVIAGETDSFSAAGDDDVYLVKTDGDGALLWEATLGGADNDEGHSVHQTADGGFGIAGITRSFGAGSMDACLIKTDQHGLVP